MQGPRAGTGLRTIPNEEPVELQTKSGKTREENLPNLMTAAEVEACQIGGVFSSRKRVACNDEAQKMLQLSEKQWQKESAI